MTRSLVLRPVDGDTGLLRDLYMDAHRDELAGLPADAVPALVDLQLRAQAAQYAASWPDAEDFLVLVDGVPAGRVWLARNDDALRVLDLVVLTAFRRLGIATEILQGLEDEARRAALPLRLSVWQDNSAARALYASMGFTSLHVGGGYLELSWLPRAAAKQLEEVGR
ncbi:MAG: hypothetical protein JWP11_1169 [Frankiales bacterium]|nr:hypothetical protein [Frankiales bacterium]